jgi:hypothetical protein
MDDDMIADSTTPAPPSAPVEEVERAFLDLLASRTHENGDPVETPSR